MTDSKRKRLRRGRGIAVLEPLFISSGFALAVIAKSQSQKIPRRLEPNHKQVLPSVRTLRWG